MTISKPYKHGSRWRCRTRTPDGWRWCPSADTPEEATAAAASSASAASAASSAEAAVTVAPGPSHPEAADDASAGSRLFRPEQEKTLKEGAQAATGESRESREGPDGVRIEGPYAHRGRWRCRIASSTGRSWCPAGKTAAHALKIAEAQAAEEARQGVRTVRECIGQYLADLERRGIRAKSIVTFRHMLHRFFAPALDDSLARVGTPHRAATLYEQLRHSTGQRTGRTLAVDTHKNMLTTARTFLGWCVDRRWLKDNPLARVKGVGLKRKGKPTLMIDASRTFLLVALREAAAGDDGALAALIGIALGLRAGEVVSRLARDVDAGGTVLQVQDTPEYGWQLKTDQSRRALGIPPYLQPLLRARAAGKAPTDLLFPSAVGKLQWSSWCNRQVARLCRLAGVPRVCMHSLRGTAATNSIMAGASPDAAARQLGHKNTGQLSGAYVPAHVVDHAARERGMESLLAGVALPSEPTAPPSPA